jgi:Glycosyltransferase family 87
MHAEPTDLTRREFLVISAVAGAIGLLAALVPTLYVPCDFIAFWSSSLLFIEGHNPYDPVLLLPLQDAAGFQTGQAIINFNTPWSLLVVAPLAGLPVRAAFAVWLGLQVALLLIAAAWLWRAFGGAASRRWVASVVTVAFVPTFITLITGQFTAATLFGVAGFLHFRTTGRPVTAGCLGALTAIKPHLFGLFAVALLIDALRCRDGRRVLAGGVGALAVFTLGTLAIDPHAFGEYFAALSAPSTAIAKGMTEYPAPVLGVMQFVPFLVATVGFLWFARSWNGPVPWERALPFLLAASLVAAPYGAWWYDMVLLLPLMLLTAVRVSESEWPAATRLVFLGFAGLDLAVLVLYSRRDELTPLFALVPVVVTLGSVALMRAMTRASALSPRPVPLGVGR